jgi:hypothetical protein
LLSLGIPFTSITMLGERLLQLGTLKLQLTRKLEQSR